MNKKVLLTGLLFSSLIYTSNIIDLIPTSTQAQDSQDGIGQNAISYDSFCISVISFIDMKHEDLFDATEGEMLDEKNMMGNDQSGSLEGEMLDEANMMGNDNGK